MAAGIELEHRRIDDGVSIRAVATSIRARRFADPTDRLTRFTVPTELEHRAGVGP